MDKITIELIDIIVALIASYLYFTCGKSRRDVSGLFCLAGASGTGMISETIYLLFRIQLFTKIRFLSPSTVSSLMTITSIIEILSVILFLIGVIRLTKSLKTAVESDIQKQ